MIFLLMIGASCATTGRSVGLGAGTGAAAGTGVGLLANPGDNGQNRVRNVLIGSAIGGALGAGVGYLGDRVVRGKEQESYDKGKSEAKKETETQINTSLSEQPQLMPAKTEARWIPDQVRGNTFVPGHFEYVIIEGAKWQTSR